MMTLKIKDLLFLMVFGLKSNQKAMSNKGHSVLQIYFFCRYEVLAIWNNKKVVAKLTYPVANTGGHVIAQLPSFVRFMTKHNSIWSKALIMPLTIWNYVFSYQQKNNFSENGHVLCSSKKLLPYQNSQVATFCDQQFKHVANGIFRGQISYLLLLISNPAIDKAYTQLVP